MSLETRVVRRLACAVGLIIACAVSANAAYEYTFTTFGGTLQFITANIIPPNIDPLPAATFIQGSANLSSFNSFTQDRSFNFDTAKLAGNATIFSILAFSFPTSLPSAPGTYATDSTFGLAVGGQVSTGQGSLTITQISTTSPTFTKAFSPTSVLVGGTTVLSFNLKNSNTIAINGVAFTDSLPSGLVVSSPNGLSNTCGGTATATAGTGSISLASGSIAAGASCEIAVHITATTAGIKNNTTSAITTIETGTGGTASASVTVVSPPQIQKTFGSSTLALNGATSLTFTIMNPNGTTALTGISFTDTLPSGVIVATPNGLTGSCGGGTITATAGSGSVSLSGASLAASASCTFSVNVTATSAGVKNNSVTVSSTQGTGNTSTASVTVASPPTITKSFGSPAISVTDTTSLTFTVSNPNTGSSLSGIGFSDTLPAGLVVATPNGLTGSCGGGTITATAGGTTISLSGATLAASASCTFAVNVTAIGSGTQNNVTSVIASREGGNGAAATASIDVVPIPEDAFQVNYISNLDLGDGTVNISNAGGSGNLCANIYVFSPDEQLQACCSCFVSPNGLISFAVVGNNGQGIPFRNPLGGTSGVLLNNPFFATTPPPYLSEWNSAVIKILFTNAADGTASCNNSATPSNTAANVTIPNLAMGGTAWGTHSHPTNTTTVAITETQFLNKPLTVLELAKASGVCSQLFAASSGKGLCTCPTAPGGLAVPVAKNRPASSLRPGL